MVGALGAMLGVLGLLGAMDGIAAGGLGGEWVERTFDVLPAAVLLAGTLGVVLLARLLRRVPGAVLAGCLVIVAPMFVAVAMDDAEFAQPLTLEEFSPFVPRGNESWELTVREWPDGVFNVGPALPIRAPLTEPDKFVAEITEKRDQIELAWLNLAEGRAWLAQLNGFAEIGESTPARMDAPWLKFAAVRAVTQVSCARAAVLALDGRGDEAADTLRPVLEVSRKLEPGARTLVRAMIARVMLGYGLDALRFVLTRTEVSPERRAALAAVLERGLGGPAGARRLMTIEYVMQFDGYYRLGVPVGVVPPRGGAPALSWLRQPLFLPRATANLYAAQVEKVARFAEKRDFARLAACERQFFESLGGGQLTNPIGRIGLAMAIPATGKIVESYWKKEDDRLALIAELRKGP